MTIYRGAGGSGDATNDATVTAVASYAAQAATSATNAATSATSSGTSATNAANSATSAANSATQAATSASNAASSQSAAATSATTAANSATSAGTQATAATNSANNAASSATAAANSASSAASDAADAETYAIRAETAETNAEAAYADTLAIFGDATDVADAVSNAAASATAAAGSATAAATSASSAASSASAASTSAASALSNATIASDESTQAQLAATEAQTALADAQAIYGGLDDVTAAVNEAEDWATQSANSATASSTSSSAAQTSANSAATSATNAANSATQAAASAASAAAIVTGVASNRPSIRPSLLLDFQYTKQLDPRITFSRPTTATYYDGKTVVKAEENLVTYSDQFDNAAWTKVSTTVTANSTNAPDGTATADTIVSAAATATMYFRRTSFLTVGTQAMISIYAKPAGWNYLAITQDGANVIYYDVNAGTIVKNDAGVTGSITSVGNGWYRLTYYTSSVQYSNLTFVIGGTSTYGSQVGDGTSGVYVWGAQVEQRSTVTAYTPTTTAPITNYIPALQTAVSNDARFDHDPVTVESKGLLIEEQRTNLLTYSDDFSNAAWAKTRSSITSNTIIAPDGTLTGDKLVEDTTASNSHVVGYTYSVANATAYTFSVYVKKSERTWIAIRASGAGLTDATYYNVDTGVLGTVPSGTTASIASVGNGWYRCSYTRTTNAAASVAFYVHLASAGNTYTYTGDGYSGIYIWGAQLEAGSFATSYIPTVASQVTRSADSAGMYGTNFSSWYRADEGTLYDESSYIGFKVADFVYTLNDGSSTTNYLGQYLNSATTMRLDSVVNNSAEARLTATVAPNTGIKAAFAYKTNDFAGSYNGATVLTDTAGAIPQGITTLGIGNRSGVYTFNGYLKRLAYYPKRLSNTELQGLTS